MFHNQKKNNRKKLIINSSPFFTSFLLGSALQVVSTSAFGGGAYIPEMLSFSSAGTAGAFNPVNDMDAMAVLSNPAGLTKLEKNQMEGGLNLLLPQIKFSASQVPASGGTNGGSAGETTPVPGYALAHRMNDQWVIGFGVAGLLGGGVEYNKDFAGRYEAIESILAGIAVTGSAGYKINNEWSVGFGVSIVQTTLDLTLATPNPVPALGDGLVIFDALDDVGTQGHFSLNYQPAKDTLLSFVYRTNLSQTLSGPIRTTGLPPTLPVSTATNISLDMEFASVYELGIAKQLNDEWRIAVSADYETWSDFANNYISIDTSNDIRVLERNWDDTWRLAFGAIYEQPGYKLSMGISYDSSAVEDEYRTADLPVDEQLRFAFGFTRNISDVLEYSLGGSYVDLGDGRITTQNQPLPAALTYEGKYKDNYMISLFGTLRYFY